MKKILLATTILGASAGFAAAEVAVSGSARMGVVQGFDSLTETTVTTFSSRVRMSFSGSGTTDGGLAFGGKFDAQDTAKADAGTAGSVFISGAFGKISMGGVDSGDAAAVGQLASVGYTGLGSTNSINYAADGFDLFGLPALAAGSKTFYYHESTYPVPDTLIDFTDINHLDPEYAVSYSASTKVSGGSAAKVLYTYAAGGLTIDASAGQISNGPTDNNSYGLGVAYTSGGLTLAAGYGSNEFGFVTTYGVSGYDIYGNETSYAWNAPIGKATVSNGSVTDATVAATYVMGDTTIKAIYQDKQVDAHYSAAAYDGEDLVYVAYDDEEVAAEATSMGLSVVHKIGAITLTAFGVSTDLTSDMVGGEQDMTFTRTGVGASYNLGGGASLTGGVVRVEAPHLDIALDDEGDITTVMDTQDFTAYDIGVNFSF